MLSFRRRTTLKQTLLKAESSHLCFYYSTIRQRSEFWVYRYSQCFLSRHEDSSADHPATPELRIGISRSHRRSKANYIHPAASHITLYHGAPVPAVQRPSVPNVQDALYSKFRQTGEPHWQYRSSVLLLQPRAPSRVLNLR